MYRIRNWNQHFENNRTREMKSMSWIPLPNKHDGDGYTELMDHPNGVAHFGAWVVLVQVASKCDPRGTLVRDSRTILREGSSVSKPHTFSSLSRITRVPESVFAEAIPRLVEIGWIESVHVDNEELTIPQEPAEKPQEPAEKPQEPAWNGTERNRKEKNTSRSRETWLTPFVAIWEKHLGGSMHCGMAARYLKPLVDKHGVEKVEMHLTNYLTATEAQYVSLARFSETFGVHDGKYKGPPKSQKTMAEMVKDWMGDETT